MAHEKGVDKGPGKGHMPKGPYIIMMRKLMGEANVCLDPWRYGLCYLKIILQIQLFATIFRVYLGISSYLYQLPWREFYHISLSKRRKMERSVINTHFFWTAPLQDINSNDAFHSIPELSVVSGTNQLSVLADFENECSWKRNREQNTNILVYIRLTLIT